MKLRETKHISATELGHTCKLSRTLVMNILRDFMKKGIVKECGKGTSTVAGGNLPTLFTFNPRFKYIFTVETQEHTLICALSDMSGSILHSCSSALNALDHAEKIFGSAANDFRTLVKRASINPLDVCAITIGAHGVAESSTGKVKMAPHFPNWDSNLDVASFLRNELSVNVPVYIDNLARLISYGAFRYNSDGKGMILVWVESGTGSGIVQHGKIYRGDHSLAGEIGHLILDPYSKDQCHCGGYGCFEVLVNPDKLPAETTAEASRNGRYIDVKTPEAVLQAANAGNPDALAILKKKAEWFAILFKNILLTIDPQTFFLEGFYAKAGDLFLDLIRNAYMQAHMASRIAGDLDIRVIDSSNMHPNGLACYAIDRHFEVTEY